MMSNYGKIVNNLMNEIYYWRVRNLEPSRIILGVEIASILKNCCSDYMLNFEVADDICLIMGIPVTVDYKNKWVLMVCVGNEWDGRDFLSI